MAFVLWLMIGQKLTCPATLEGHEFLRVSIYNGVPGKQEYELAPDDNGSHGNDVRQSWNLSDYRDSALFVRCRFADTSTVVIKDLPNNLQKCLFTWRNRGGEHPIVHPAFLCR